MKTTSTGLPSNVAAALACIPLLGGLVFLLLEKSDRFVRFYAMQSIVFGGAWLIFSVAWNILHAILYPIPWIGWFFGLILWILSAMTSIVGIVLWIVATLKAFAGKIWEIPYFGPIARQQVGGLA